MSDRVLMESWRKFLAEVTPDWDAGYDATEFDDIRHVPEGPGQDTIDTTRYSYPNSSGCVTVDGLIKSIELTQQSYEVSDIRDEKIAYVTKMAKEAGMDVALAIAIASSGIVSGGGAMAVGLIPTAFRMAKHFFLGEPPPSTIKGIEAFVDHINIAQPYQDVFNKNEQRKIDDEYIKYLQKEHPSDCVEKVMDINKFIQEHYKLCKDSYPSTKPIDVARREILPGEGGRDYGENPLTSKEAAEEEEEIVQYKQSQPRQSLRRANESKFHDDWRNFLLTEEKL